MIKTNYIFHDTVYRHKLSKDGGMWSSQEQLESDCARLTHHLHFDSVPQSGRVLELGCGTGELSRWLRSRGYEVTGVDISETAIGEAKKRSENLDIEYICDDITRTDRFSIGLFDLVVENWFLHCIVGDDRKNVLKTVNSLLVENGVFIGATMCSTVVGTIFDNSYDPKTGIIFDGDTASRYVGQIDALEKEFGDAGFRFVSTTHKRIEDKNTDSDEFYYVLRKT